MNRQKPHREESEKKGKNTMDGDRQAGRQTHRHPRDKYTYRERERERQREKRVIEKIVRERRG